MVYMSTSLGKNTVVTSTHSSISTITNVATAGPVGAEHAALSLKDGCYFHVSGVGWVTDFFSQVGRTQVLLFWNKL